MSFLPIVQRELRAAARRKSTFRVRWWSALALMGVTLVLTGLAAVTRRGGGLGGPVFNLVTWYIFGLCLLAGPVLTADALSAEKRDGTLGLLFLTNLKGYDVVLGKFIARSLNAFYGLLALLPVIALPVLLGGVTGGELWRMALALVNALFFSLTLGLCVSAFRHEAARAIGDTLGLIVLLVAGLPAVVSLAASAQSFAWVSASRWITPYYPFYNATGYLAFSRVTDFWGSLLGSHLAGWALLALASVVLPWTWKVPAVSNRGIQLRNWYRRGTKVGGGAAARAKLLSRNPVLWLSSGEMGIPWGAWVVVATWGCLVTVLSWTDPGALQSTVMGQYLAMPFGLLLKVLFAFQVCRFFTEGRRTGALELLLCTPLTDREIVRGHLLALWRAFRWPLVAFIIFLFAPAATQIIAAISHQSFTGTPPAVLEIFAKGVYCARMLADFAALCWFGMGLALTMKKPANATALTILFVLVLPAFLCWLDFAADLVLIAWGVSRTQQDLRRMLVQQYQSPIPTPPLLTPSERWIPPPVR
jgi:ABC-type transport system involved in multi-copper enzyme maturation permease subunit